MKTGKWRRDELRTARLHFDPELTAGGLRADELDVPAVRAGARVRRVPSRPLRAAERTLAKLGKLDYERSVLPPLLSARRAVLGRRAAAPPRFLVRVDEFPHARAWAEPSRFDVRGYERFHAILAGAGVDYLVAVLPRLSQEPLSPHVTESRALDEEELDLLRRLSEDGVSFALHGRDHRTRNASPRRHSELCGLNEAETDQLLDEATAALAIAGIRAEVFVAPYNRFDARQLPLLARRFTVVCGGPESVGLLGFHATPQWRGETVYLPAYPPFYGRADEISAAATRAIEQRWGLWVPLVLHWGWEQEEGWRGLERLAPLIAPYTWRWEDFLRSVARSSEARP